MRYLPLTQADRSAMRVKIGIVRIDELSAAVPQGKLAHALASLPRAKAMIEEGYSQMTLHFPLVVHGAMLIEPTESESKASLGNFIAT